MLDPLLAPVNILLVDDHPANLFAFESILRCPEYNLVTASSGFEALDRIRTQTFAAVLLDVQMPGIDGFETARQIRAFPGAKDTPIIFVTAIHRENRKLLEGYATGGVDYLFKPVDPDLLKSKVAVFVELYRNALALRQQKEKMAKLVAIQCASIEALSRAEDSETAVASVLEAIGKSLGWDVGVYWNGCPSPGSFECANLWSHGDFKTRAWFGEIASMRVWSQSEPLWTVERGVNLQLRSAVAFPVRVSGKTFGLMEYFSREPQKEDVELAKVLSAVGDQIGLFVGHLDSLTLARNSEAQRAAIREAALDSIISTDSEGRILEFNEAAERTFGYSRSEAIGNEMAGLLIPPRLREGHRRDLKQYLVTGKSISMNRRIEMAGLRSDGVEIPIELAVTSVAGLEPPVFTVFIRDITERKRTEQELRDHQQDLKETLRELEHLVDDQRFLVKASGSLSESLDYVQTIQTIVELIVPFLADGCSIDVINEEGHLANAASFPTTISLPKTNAVSVSQSGHSQLIEVVSDDFREQGIRSMMIVPLIMRGRAFGSITLTSTKKGRRYTSDDLAFAEEVGRRAAMALDNASLYKQIREAVDARDEFISIASHELKTPITTLRLQLDLTRRTVKPEENIQPTPQKLAKVLDISTYQVDRLTNLVEHLLDVSKIRAGKLEFNFEEIGLSALLYEILERLQNLFAASNVTVETRIQAEVTISGDRVRIDQVITNLLTNAIKYGGEKPVHVSLEMSNGCVRFVVRDSGIGIEREKQAKIFGRFERAVSSRQITGLGLGLYITKQIVNAHHGEVIVESELGHGSTFTVELPAAGQIALGRVSR